MWVFYFMVLVIKVSVQFYAMCTFSSLRPLLSLSWHEWTAWYKIKSHKLSTVRSTRRRVWHSWRCATFPYTLCKLCKWRLNLPPCQSNPFPYSCISIRSTRLQHFFLIIFVSLCVTNYWELAGRFSPNWKLVTFISYVSGPLCQLEGKLHLSLRCGLHAYVWID